MSTKFGRKVAYFSEKKKLSVKKNTHKQSETTTIRQRTDGELGFVIVYDFSDKTVWVYSWISGGYLARGALSSMRC